MPYTNAQELLPTELVAELQKYAAGEVIYIPRPPETRRPWGQVSGLKERLLARNSEIKALKAQGLSVETLADRFFLSPDGIRKVLSRSSTLP